MPSWQPRHAPYSSAKALVIALTVNMRPEPAEHGIGCTVICPGGVATNVLNTPSHRPERFGGAAATEVTPAGGDSGQFRYRVRTAEQVARMTLRAVRRDELFVLTDGSMRSLHEDYSKEVPAAFDTATEFESDPVFS
ncbi:SDR family NAD(P)-dependent oxidoreductase [Streptosporangium sp. NPDC002544]|uniref:SDR family NAD(P)-dependent oxidoreductase n=1 Tax=Streptosporangium sp. NPDC002544 TaxID=3154538 RepID=UPI00331A5EAC